MSLTGILGWKLEICFSAAFRYQFSASEGSIERSKLGPRTCRGVRDWIWHCQECFWREAKSGCTTSAGDTAEQTTESTQRTSTHANNIEPDRCEPCAITMHLVQTTFRYAQRVARAEKPNRPASSSGNFFGLDFSEVDEFWAWDFHLSS